MTHPDFTFKITNKTQVHADLQRGHVVISCTTKDGKSLHLEMDYQALEQIHQEIQKQLNG